MAHTLSVLIVLLLWLCFIESLILDRCSKWNESAGEIIFGNETGIGTDDEKLLNLAQSFLHITHQTNQITFLDDHHRRVIIFDRFNRSFITTILLDDSSSAQLSPSASVIMADGPNNTFYIMDFFRQELSIIQPPLTYGSHPSVHINESSPGNHSFLRYSWTGFSVDPIDGSLYLYNRSFSQIHRYQPNHNWTSYINTTVLSQNNSLWNNITSIVIDGQRRLFISDFGNNRIQVFDYNSGNVRTLLQVAAPLSLSLPSPHLLLVTKATSVFLYNMTDRDRRCIIGCDSTLKDIRRAVLDNHGNLIVAIENHLRFYPIYRQCFFNNFTTPFVPLNLCPAGRLGITCTFADDVCNVSQPCQNGGLCMTNATIQHGYLCLCPGDFDGPDCQIDRRICQFSTCRNQGICRNISLTEFECDCQPGYEGKQCDHLVDLCKNLTCQNGGICFQKLFNTWCQCLLGFHGEYCEIRETTQIARQYATKSLGYIAIIMLSFILIFTITMDILKYFFDIDPVKIERRRLQLERSMMKKKIIERPQPKAIIRFRYVQ